MGALAVEIWTTNKGIKMDNFAIGHDEASMKAFYEATLPPKLKAYEAQDADEGRRRRRPTSTRRAEGGLMNQAELLLSDAIEKAKGEPRAGRDRAPGGLATSFIFLCCRGGGDAAARDGVAPAPATEATRPRRRDERR